MSRTKRNERAILSAFRNPKGHAKYKNNARNGAIPPDSWEDIINDPETKIPLKAMNRMKKKNIPRDEAILKIRNKWGFTAKMAEKLASMIYDQ